MSGATCPACGVAVLPGYARCPKCKAPLPFGAGTKSAGAGGTSLEGSKLPVVPLLAVGAIAIGIAVFFGMRSKDPSPAAPAEPAAVSPVIEPPTVESGGALPPTTPAAPARPSATESAAELERALRKQRLWSTVEVLGDRVDMRSGSCQDAELGPIVDGAASSLKDSGLTKLRCLEQSGRVVFQRDL